MADYVELLKDDLLEQFKEKKVIAALLEAIGEQMTEVWTFFHDLETMRSLQSAVGKQLDRAGDIVVLSRKEAGELACIPQSVMVLSDDDYRRYLYHKVWKNTCRCTYSDIIHSLSMFWEFPLYYSEDINVPATIMLETSEVSPEDDTSRILNAPLVKAAGVAIKITAITKTPMPPYALNVYRGMGRGYMSTRLPELARP